MQLDYSLILDGKSIKFRIFSQEKICPRYDLFHCGHIDIHAVVVPGLYAFEIYLRGSDHRQDDYVVVRDCRTRQQALSEFKEYSEVLRMFVLWHNGECDSTSSNVM